MIDPLCDPAKLFGMARIVLAGSMLVGGCGMGADHEAATNARIADLESRLEFAEAQKEKARADAAVAAYEQSVRPAVNATGKRDQSPIASELPARTIDMCYKGYCPCDPPQGGPDTALCDQLEEGIQPPVDLLIAGRAMREARQQIATGDY